MSKKKELVLYVVFGVLTTLVAFIVYQGLQWVLIPRWGPRSYLFSNTVAFIAAVIFAYVVNKLFVFEQKSWEPRLVVREAATFVSTRVFTLVLETGLLALLIEVIWPRVRDWFTPLWLGLPYVDRLPEGFTPAYAYESIVRWGFIAVLVMVLNFVFAKWIVFRKKEEPKEEDSEADIVEC